MSERPRTIEERVTRLETIVRYSQWAVGILVAVVTMAASVWGAVNSFSQAIRTVQ